MLERNVVHWGRNEDLIKKLESNSVQLCVTSPPYDNLREYNSEFDFPLLANELYRVLKIGGVVVWNVTDAVIKKTKTGTSLKQCLYFKEIGFLIHDYMFYEKNSPSYPSSEKDNRYSNVIEFVFILSKGVPSIANLICDKKNIFAGQKLFGKKGSSQDGKIVKEYSPRTNIWRYVTSTGQETLDHTAVFPEEFAKDHIATWSNEGDLVIDIFSGSGTTGKMALSSGRQFIGFELDQEMCEKSNKKLIKYKSSMEFLKGFSIPNEDKKEKEEEENFEDFNLDNY